MADEKRIDPEDGSAYTLDELKAYYRGKFKAAAIASYFQDVCKPVKAKRARARKA